MRTEAAEVFIIHKLEKELPHYLTYHNVQHTKNVIRYAKELAVAEAIGGEDMDILLTAAAFHDTGFIETYSNHEEASCTIARNTLKNFGYTAEQTEHVCRLILATCMPQQPQTRLEEIICDADLYYIGTSQYVQGAEALYHELQHTGIRKSRKEWMEEQRAFLVTHRYFTDTANTKLAGRQQQNLDALKDMTKPVKEQYIGGLFHGTMSMIPVPADAQLAIYSQAVYHNSPYKKQLELLAEGKAGNPIPQKVGDASPIKHVFYIIKENRTYDQVLGDVKEGNGDTNIVIFGKKITPNQHKLVHDFVLLDNFYVNGTVSADGHNWSTAAYATDYLEKIWPTSYSGRGGDYSGEGTRDIANGKNGFIWDDCKKYGVTYRTYGEFADDGKPNIPVLKDHLCPTYLSWDQDVMDTTRYREWATEFDSLVKVGQVPQMNTLRMINDHTMGLSKGKKSPFAQVADNDLAVGLFVEHLSQSPIWKESVVFILEDDAQSGSDHVDAHRSTAYVAGGLVKQGFVDHTAYYTASMLRTMELILGLPPMSQYDAAAPSMWRCFNDSTIHPAFHAVGAETDLYELNLAMNKWSEMSDKFDFTAEDRAPDQLLNQVLWYAAKGDGVPYPAPVHSAFIMINPKADKDDDD